MEKMILLGTHGRFGEELIKSAELILGEMKDVRSFSLLPGMALEDYIPSVAETLGKLPKGTLCLVDLFGGTPCNAFCALSREYGNAVVTGLNLAMLMEVYMNKDQLSNQELADLAVFTLKESGKNATRILGETP
jgi:PTS system mannose-specific IIA component/D-glucosaminate-specific PTS system IIA component